MTAPQVVSREQWLAARKELLRKEKEHTRQRDALAAERRKLPWVRVDKDYTFEGPRGRQTLADLFGSRNQLAIYHFMLGPGWEHGCVSCSLAADQFDGAMIHLAQRDVTFTVVSRAPYAEIAPFRERMGWRFPWVSSHGSDFNFDFRVSFTKEELAAGSVDYNYAPSQFPSEEAPGMSIFARGEDGAIYHSYSTYTRGLEPLLGVYYFLDLVPKGRGEEDPNNPMSWVRHHDRYPALVMPPQKVTA